MVRIKYRILFEISYHLDIAGFVRENKMNILLKSQIHSSSINLVDHVDLYILPNCGQRG